MAFLLTGQAMKHHNPPVHSLAPEVRMMYVSRHIYLLGAALLNVALGIYSRCAQLAGVVHFSMLVPCSFFFLLWRC